jgi:hypothetical protein
MNIFIKRNLHMSNAERKIKRNGEKNMVPVTDIRSTIDDVVISINTQLKFMAKTLEDTGEDEVDENGDHKVSKIHGYVKSLNGILNDAIEVAKRFDSKFKGIEEFSFDNEDLRTEFHQTVSDTSLLVERLTDLSAIGLTSVTPIHEMGKEAEDMIKQFTKEAEGELHG